MVQTLDHYTIMVQILAFALPSFSKNCWISGRSWRDYGFSDQLHSAAHGNICYPIVHCSVSDKDQQWQGESWSSPACPDYIIFTRAWLLPVPGKLLNILCICAPNLWFLAYTSNLYDDTHSFTCSNVHWTSIEVKTSAIYTSTYCTIREKNNNYNNSTYRSSRFSTLLLPGHFIIFLLDWICQWNFPHLPPS